MDQPAAAAAPAEPRAVVTPDAEDYAKVVRCIERMTGRRIRDIDPEQLPRIVNL
jgi:hypothetical protein